MNAFPSNLTPPSREEEGGHETAERRAEAKLAAGMVLPDPTGGCVCTPHWQDAGGGHTEFVPEYEPACPEHSEHLYNPRTGIWEIARTVDVVFDGPPAPQSGRFIEVENEARASVRVGEWIDRGDGYWALRMRAVS